MDKKEAIEFLQKRANEAPALARLPYSNQDAVLWRNSIEDVLEEVFGLDSTEYKRFYETRIKVPSGLTAVRRQNLYVRQLQKRQTEILSILKKYEILGVPEATEPIETEITEPPIALFDAMQFHPRVVKSSRKRFNDGNYTDAILRAFIEVNNFIKTKTGLELDGKSLMAQVFRIENPVIQLNEFLNQSDRDEQEGFMFLYMGAMVGIRNPKAHENLSQRDPIRTLEYLSFASLLMRRVDEGKVAKPRTRKSKIHEEIFIKRCLEGDHQKSVDLYHKIKSLLDERKEDYINWGVSGYSYRMPWKGYPNGETLFVALSDGKLTIWPDLLARTGKTGEKYLENLRNMPVLTNEFRKHKYPTISTDLMETSDIDKFIAAIKELGDSLDEASREQ